MSRSRWLLPWAAAVLAAWPGCGRTETASLAQSAAAAADATPELIVVAGAKNVMRASRSGVGSLEYELDAEFPAAAPILDVVKRLQALGWTALKEDPINPGIPTSMVRSWTSYVDASRPARRREYRWTSEWQEAKGHRVTYAFRYESAEHPVEPLRHLFVAAGSYPAELTRRLEFDSRRAGEEFARSHPGPPPDDDGGQTVLPAQTGDAFLVSGPAGEAVVQVTDRPGGQVAYRWRFRDASGKTESGSVPVSAMMSAGPFALSWQSRDPFERREDLGAVGYPASAMTLLPVPGGQFETLDLAAVHALATLLPDRNERYRRGPTPGADAPGGPIMAMMTSGSSLELHRGQALLVQGKVGTGVIIILEPDMRSVKYRSRFLETGSKKESSGELVATDSPFPILKVGPYSLQWWMRRVEKVSDERGTRLGEWSGEAKYLPEEVTVAVIPDALAERLQLESVGTVKTLAP